MFLLVFVNCVYVDFVFVIVVRVFVCGGVCVFVVCGSVVLC